MGSLRTLFVCGCLALASAPAAADPYCTGEYAEDLGALSPRARDAEAHAKTYVYAVRTSATYECVAYGGDGNLKKTRVATVAHGTAFGYRRDGNDTLLLTNEHVAEWPAITDAQHPVDGVPNGCKRVADSQKIVDDDHDDYAADDIPLTRVVADPTLDVAILRAKVPLEIVPWRIGKSAALSARDAVEVRGFPLGAFQATNVGKVISAYDHDDQGEWNHDDFVVDALLTQGGSGSPVLAVSCKTGELELVGIFHARYSAASALNVVVAIDQVRDLMTTLKRSPRPVDHPAEPDAAARTRLVDAVRQGEDPPFFSFGGNVASVHARGDGTLVFTVFGADFPRTSRPLLVVEDVAADKAFGKPGATYLGGTSGLHAVPADGDAESQALIARVLDLLRHDALAAFELRAASAGASASRATYESYTRQKRALEHMLDGQRDIAQALADLAARTKPSGAMIKLADLD